MRKELHLCFLITTSVPFSQRPVNFLLWTEFLYYLLWNKKRCLTKKKSVKCEPRAHLSESISGKKYGTDISEFTSLMLIFSIGVLLHIGELPFLVLRPAKNPFSQVDRKVQSNESLNSYLYTCWTENDIRGKAQTDEHHWCRGEPAADPRFCFVGHTSAVESFERQHAWNGYSASMVHLNELRWS